MMYTEVSALSATRKVTSLSLHKWLGCSCDYKAPRECDNVSTASVRTLISNWKGLILYFRRRWSKPEMSVRYLHECCPVPVAPHAVKIYWGCVFTDNPDEANSETVGERKNSPLLLQKRSNRVGWKETMTWSSSSRNTDIVLDSTCPALTWIIREIDSYMVVSRWIQNRCQVRNRGKGSAESERMPWEYSRQNAQFRRKLASL